MTLTSISPNIMKIVNICVFIFSSEYFTKQARNWKNLWTMSEVSGAELNLCIIAQVTIGALGPLVHDLTLLKLHLLFTCNWFYSVNQIMFLIQFAWLKWLLSLFVIKSNLHKIFLIFFVSPLTFNSSLQTILFSQYCFQGNPFDCYQLCWNTCNHFTILF